RLSRRGLSRDRSRSGSGSCRRVGQFAQSVEFVGALKCRAYQKLPRLGMMTGVNERTARRRHRRIQWRARTVRRAKCQDQDEDGEEYAAHWENTKNRQHRLCITESGTIPKPGPMLAA